MLKETILCKIREKKLPIVIAGAGVVGSELLALCEKEGLEVAAFCDSSEKVAGRDFQGREVIFTPKLPTRFGDAAVLISVAAIKDAVDLLKGLGFDNWFAGGPLLKGLATFQDNSDGSLDYRKFAIENCIICHDGYLHPENLFLRSIDVMITERCSLRCRDCSNLMQYYQKPRDGNLAVIMASIDALCSVVDEVMDFRVIGGDAFMGTHWPAVVRRLTSEPKARRVVVYTNGTLVPKERDLESLRHGKVLVIATDYGRLSRRLEDLRRTLATYGISHHVLHVSEWLDCATIRPRGRTAAEDRLIFRRCCAKNMATLSDGRLFRCPYAANAARLGAVPDFAEDYVDVLSLMTSGEDAAVTKEKVRRYLLELDMMKTCGFCSGRPLAGNEVVPAVQTPTPLPYTRYADSRDATATVQGGAKI